MAGSSGSTTSTTKTEPSKEQKPYLFDPGGVLPEAARLYGQGAPPYYPGQTVAPISPETNAAWNMQTARGMAGSPLNAAAQGYTQDVLGGNYLSQGNPYLGAVHDSMWSAVSPQINSLFTSAGRYGSGAQAESLAQGYTNAIAPYDYGAYAQERGMQEAAAQRAPGLAATDYQDIAAVGNVGAQRQAQEQALINASMQRYGYEAGAPADWLRQYAGLVTGDYGGTTQQQTPYYMPPGWQQALGAGLDIAGTAAMFM